MKKNKELWEKTKSLYASVPKVPPLSESKLKKPSFRTIIELIKCTIQSTSFAKGLFSDDELLYANYDTIDPELRFLERLIEFLEHFGKTKFKYTPISLLKSENDSKEIHKILQFFSKCANIGKSSKDAVKETKKKPILLQKTEPESKGKARTSTMNKTTNPFSRPSAQQNKNIFGIENQKPAETMRPRYTEEGKGEIAKARSDGSKIDKEIENLARTKDFLSREIGINSEKAKTLSNDVENLKKKLSDCTAEVNELENLKKANFSISDWEKKKEKERKSIEQKKADSQAKDAKIAKLKEQLQKERGENEVGDKSSNNTLLDMEQKNANLKGIIAEIIKSSNLLESDSDYKEKTEELRALDDNKNKLKASFDKLKEENKLEELQKEMDKMNSEIELITREKDLNEEEKQKEKE